MTGLVPGTCDDRRCGQPTALMVPAHSEGTEKGDLEWAAARAVCAGCPSRTPCLVYATTTRQPDGCWGGTAPDERGISPRIIGRGRPPTPRPVPVVPKHPRPVAPAVAERVRERRERLAHDPDALERVTGLLQRHTPLTHEASTHVADAVRARRTETG